MALAKRAAVLARANGIIEANLRLLHDFFARRQDVFAWSAPAAGCIAYVRLKGGRSALKFCRDLVDQKGCAAPPGRGAA